MALTRVDEGWDRQTDNTNASVTLTGLQDGDILVAVQVKQGTGGTLTFNPTGWTTEIAETAAVNLRVAVYADKFASGDSATFTSTHTDTSTFNHGLWVGAWRGGDQTTWVDAKTSMQQHDNVSDPVITGLTTTVDGAIVLTFAAINAGANPGNWQQGAPTFGTFLEEAVTGVPRFGVTEYTKTTAGATGTNTFNTDAAATADWLAGMIAIRPAAAASQDITPAAVTVTATPGTLTVDMSVAPTGPTVTATPGTLTVTTSTPVTPAATTVTATPGTLTITTSTPVTPDPVTVTATPGTLTITTSTPVTPAAVTVTVTAGSLDINAQQAITPDSTTVTATPGTVTLDLGFTPAALTVTAAAGTVTLDLNVALTGPTVTATPGTLTVSQSAPVTPAAATVTVTAGTLVVSIEGGFSAVSYSVVTMLTYRAVTGPTYDPVDPPLSYRAKQPPSYTVQTDEVLALS